MAIEKFETEAYKEIHDKALERYKEVEDYESVTRQLQNEDLEFAYRDQWKPGDRVKRDGEKRPCIIVRLSKQFLDHIKNENRQNKPQIKVSPIDDGAQEVHAKNRQGLIRHIQYESKAAIAFQRSYDFAVDMGRGWFEIVTDYVHSGSFDQKIAIETVSDQFSIYPDPAHEEPDYSDMKWCFKNERMRREVFEDRWPDADLSEWKRGSKNQWIEKDFVTVGKYYVIEEKERELWRVNIGGVEENIYVDEIEGDHKQYKSNIVEKRTIKTNMVKIYFISGEGILEEQDSVFTIIPLVPMIGEETLIENTYDLKGVTRDLIDLGRQYNFYNSQETEIMSNAPKTPYIGAVGQFEGVEDQWEDNDSASHYKEYNPVSHAGNLVGPPQRADFVNFPQGLAQGKQEIRADMQAVTGYYNTSSGAMSNETSGTAIKQRINQGNTASFHFQDNANNALTSAGRIINDALPKVYKRKGRIITILGEDDEESTFSLVGADEDTQQNNSEAGEIGHFGKGEFSVVVSVGASYDTKRQEAVANMMEMSAKVPMVGEASADLIIKSQDWPLKDQIAERTKRRIEMQSPGLTAPIDDGKDSELAQMAEQMKQLQGKLQEVGQKAEQMAAELDKVDQEKVKTDSMKAQKDLKEIAIKEEEVRLKSREIQADIKKVDITATVDIKKAEMASATALQVERMRITAKSIDAKVSQKKGKENESGSNRTPG